MLKNKIMKIAEKQIKTLHSYVNQSLRDIRNGLVHSQGSPNKQHGKAGEIAISKLFNFRDENGNLFDQNGNACDIPKSVAERSNLPKEFHHDIEIKFYEKKRKTFLMGDAIKKMQKIKNGLVLIVLFYDKAPCNVCDLKIVKVEPCKHESDFDRMAEIATFVKDRSNPIKGFGGTREKVRKENAKLKTARFYLNDNSNSSSNTRQVQLCYKLNC